MALYVKFTNSKKMGELDKRGLLFSSRFERLRETGDIQKAISFLGDAVQLMPDGHADKPGRLNNLGILLSRRFEGLGEMGDIEKAISNLEDTVKLIPDGHADKPSRLSNLGISLLRHFRRLGEMGGIEKTISSLEDVVRLTPDGRTDKPGQLSNHGYSLLRHFERLGEMGDIEKAISSLKGEVQLTQDGHPDRPSLLNNIGSSLFSHFEFCQDPKDLKRSIFAAYQSATQSTGPLSQRFHAAISWSHRAHLCRDDSVPSALDAYATAFELLPRMSWVGLSIPSRHRELVSARTLGCDAAATAISEKHLHKALEWLEQGRSVLWGQILHLRTPLDGLHAADPKLAAKLTSIATDLERGSSQAFLAGDDNQVSPEEATQKHRRLADEWETVVEQVRKLPDFERFLLPKEYSELRDAARSGPVIVLNASRYGCDALIIASPLELRHVRLDKLTYEHADFLLKLLYAALDSQQLRDERHLARLSKNQLDKDATFRDVLGQLWEMVVKPVLGCIESFQVSDQISCFVHCL
jgi:tetratricopeptide (TPR) repeat protein